MNSFGVAASRPEQRQVFRSGRETVIYTIQAPAIFLRTRGTNPLLPTEYLYSSHPPARTRTDSIDASVDDLVRRQPRDESWISPELRVPLYSKLTAAGVEVTSVAVAISRDFKRVE